jgi:uncharacterized protein
MNESPSAMSSIPGITEDEIANYLAHTPGFFERHAELLASVELANPHGARAVSLQQRQMEMLRERIRGLERRIMDMIRHGQENAGLTDRLHDWTRNLMLCEDPRDLPDVMVLDLKEQFLIPSAAIRVWSVQAGYEQEPFALGVSDEVKAFAQQLASPYCGANARFEAMQWLSDCESIASLAMVPLRRDVGAPTFGLMVLGSPDPTRYTADMGTEFLSRVGELASAALTRVLPATV